MLMNTRNNSTSIIVGTAILVTTFASILGGWKWLQRQQDEKQTETSSKKQQQQQQQQQQQKQAKQPHQPQQIQQGKGVVEEQVTKSTRSNHENKNNNFDEMFSRPPVSEINPGLSSNKSKGNGRRRVLSRGTISIAHGSVTGTCAKFAEELARTLRENNTIVNQKVFVGNVQEWDWWDELINEEEGEEDDDDDDDNQWNNNNDSHNSEYRIPKLILLLPTYTNGTWTPCAATTLQVALQDLNNDWRIEKFPLKQKLQIAIFGMGSSEYDDEIEGKRNKTMGKPAKEACVYFQKLGAKMFGPKLHIGDDSISDHAAQAFRSWTDQILQQLQKQKEGKGKQQQQQKQKRFKHKLKKQKTIIEVQNEDDDAHGEEKKDDNGNDHDCNHVHNDDNGDYNDNDDDEYDDEEEDDNHEPEVIDLEDIGEAIVLSNNNNKKHKGPPREMVTPSQAKALRKEGYKLIGTHSAVKLCRWTKHQLRGRGGCYKHTFYGITSYQCMEATPSLACANKCVFCWRHHKNPVGKEWKWKTDDPKYIVKQAIASHVKMIKETKGIPGVRQDRWKEAHTVRHCALSLVGEPIMYPHINQLLHELHRKTISTYLVTNGQHPEAIEKLLWHQPITQLYVSIDASNPEALVEIDRPLFNDAWDRLKQSLVALKKYGSHQRTVARLTIVKGFNMADLKGYAKLIALGQVSLIEVKGVTFCGKSDASNLNMTNTPWHHEVVEFVKILKDEINQLRQDQMIRKKNKKLKQQPTTRTNGNDDDDDDDDDQYKVKSDSTGGDEDDDDTIPEYDLACEHKHSCSVLMARVDQFAVDTIDPDNPDRTIRKWRTWIDYDKFNELVMRHSQDPTFKYKVEDYCADTPTWAYMGCEEAGFDPTDKRHYRKKKYPKYTKYDDNGIPTHDHNNEPLSEKEREELTKLMNAKIREIQAQQQAMNGNVVNGGGGYGGDSDASTVITSASTVITNFTNDGAREIHDARLMFRGLVVVK